MARIALNARLLIPGKLEGTGRFTHQCYKRIILSRPNDQFLLIFDRKPPEEFNFGLNSSSVYLFPPARRPWLFDLWFDYAITWKLKQWRADAFVSTDGYISRRSSIRQLNVIHDINFEHHPEWLPPRFAKTFQITSFPEYARKSSKLCTVSEFSRGDISRTYNRMKRIQYQSSPTHLMLLLNHLGPEQRDSFKKEICFGDITTMYFVGSIHPRKNIHGMLKAHKVYRRLGGNSDLVIVGAEMWKHAEFDTENVHWVGRSQRR